MQIVKNPSKNQQYQLIERNRYLVQFENLEQERDYHYSQFVSNLSYSRPILALSFLIGKMVIVMDLIDEENFFGSL